MATRYQIMVKDAIGAVVAVITNPTILTFTKVVNGVGGHMLQIDGASAAAALFDLDYQVEVWRRDIAAVPVIPWYLEYEGFHRTPAWETTAEGDDLFTSHGLTYEDLLSRRIILFAKESAGAVKTGVGETVIKEYVDENAGPGATFPPRLLASGVMAGLTIQADLAAGGAWEGDRAYENLLDVVREVTKATGIDFRIVGTGPATFQFQAGDLATDRTTDGLNPMTGLNGAGNPPVIFSLYHGNMTAPVYSVERREEANAAIVLGQGIEGDRTIIQRTDAVAIADSPWNRREATRNANQEDAAAGLQTAGDALLHELQARTDLMITVMQTPASLYGREYFLGDLVTIRYKTFEVNRQIQAVTIAVADGRETIEITMGNPP